MSEHIAANVCLVCSNWLEEKSKNRVLEERAKTSTLYEVEVKTGKMKVSWRG